MCFIKFQIRTHFSPFLACFSYEKCYTRIVSFNTHRVKELLFNMEMKIQDLNISAASKSALKGIGITMVSQLEGQNYITLINRFPKNYNIEPLIHELNSLGYLLPPDNEISIYDIPMSKRLQNSLIRNGIMYLSQLSSLPKEEIMRFRNLGEKTAVELEHICEKYNIEIRSMISIKEYFDKFHFPPKMYPLLFKSNIFSMEDFNHMTTRDLYHICQKNYYLTMQVYFILVENKITFDDWQDKFIFEILPEKKAIFLWKRHEINKLSQLPNCSEYKLKQSLLTSNSFSATLKETLS